MCSKVPQYGCCSVAGALRWYMELGSGDRGSRNTHMPTKKERERERERRGRENQDG